MMAAKQLKLAEIMNMPVKPILSLKFYTKMRPKTALHPKQEYMIE